MTDLDPYIYDLNDFVDKLIKLTSKSQEIIGSQSIRLSDKTITNCFRGQAKFDWDLSPRLYREGLFKVEKALIDETERIAVNEFQDLATFDRLIKMQHYGLPTRLLDFTKNPLVALFFACYDKNPNLQEIDGAVFCFQLLPLYNPYDWDLYITMKYIFEHSDQKFDINHFIEELCLETNRKLRINGKLPTPFAILDVLAGSPPFNCIQPSLKIERVGAQDGVFMVFGMQELKCHNDNWEEIDLRNIEFSPYSGDIENEPIRYNNFKFLIDGKSKKKILKQLESFGITKNKLFPELEHQIEYVTQQIMESNHLLKGLKSKATS